MLRILNSLFGRSNLKKADEVVPTQIGSLDTVVWPSLEEMCTYNDDRMYQVVQVKYDGRLYYRFSRLPSSSEGIEPHAETKNIAKKFDFNGKWDKISGHPAALDVFVRELVQKGYDPAKVESVRGCDAYHSTIDINAIKQKHVPSRVKFYVFGASSTFGEPDEIWLKMDMLRSDPAHLNLYFEDPFRK